MSDNTENPNNALESSGDVNPERPIADGATDSVSSAAVSPYGTTALPNGSVDQPQFRPSDSPVNYGNGAFGPPAPSTLLIGPDGLPVGAPSEITLSSASNSPKKRGAGILVAALAVGALVGGASGAGVTAWTLSHSGGNSSTQPTSPQAITINNPDKASLVTAVAAKASPSVVTLAVSGGQSAGSGSGVILSADGYILTNTHVVTLDGATSSPDIRITTADGKNYSGKIVGTDPVADLAVVKIDGASGLVPITFGDSSALNVGDAAIAIGEPLGLSGTVTSGIVSALNRSITIASSAAPDASSEQPAPDQDNGQSSPYDFWNFDIPGQGQQAQPQGTASSISLAVIQTDAAINPGNSGGALLNSQGELIGINVAIASAGNSSSDQSGSIGVGFSIPSNFAKRIADEIIANGTATHGLLGASITAATDSATQSSAVSGAKIAEVTAGGAADSAGIKKGDVVTVFNGIPVASATDLTAQVRVLPAGAKTQVTVLRDGNEQTVEVTLGKLTS